MDNAYLNMQCIWNNGKKKDQMIKCIMMMDWLQLQCEHQASIESNEKQISYTRTWTQRNIGITSWDVKQQ